MWPFKKKKEEQKQESLVIPEIPHQHVWKDMPWYMGVHYHSTNRTAGYIIVEPYICITCGERKNITLEEEDYSNISPDEREAIFSRVRKRYKKYLKPRAIVEDMINNILLVKDPHYLDTIEVMRGSPHRKCGTSAEMERQDSDLKIETEETEK
jgi:hypothetical protein